MIDMKEKKYITFGNNSAINTFGYLSATRDAPITIGNNVQIGPYIVMSTSDHNYKDPNVPIYTQGHTRAPIRIDDDVWIGANVTILRGVHIPQGCVIGACSLIRHSDTLEPFGVYAGNPLRKIGSRLKT